MLGKDKNLGAASSHQVLEYFVDKEATFKQLLRISTIIQKA